MSTTAKFSLDNPFHSWPKTPEMDVQILINKLNDLRAEVADESWKNLIITDPNQILREIECQKVSVLFACPNDLKYGIQLAHVPFICRLTRTKLVVLKPGSAQELRAYFGKNNLFMIAISNLYYKGNFAAQFSDIDPINPNLLPQVTIKK